MKRLAVKDSKYAMKPGSVFHNKTVVDALTKDGSKITDWSKRTTKSVELSNGQKVQVHFYQNEVTGKIDYTHADFKLKEVINGFNVRPPELLNSRYKPLNPQDILVKYKPKF